MREPTGDRVEAIEGVTGEAVARVLSYVLRNSNPYNGVDGNYVKNIADELGMTTRRTHRAVDMLEHFDLVERRRSGRKKIIVPQDWPGQAGDREAADGPIWG